jgi:8-amino-7-oxononanoate synthase
VPTAQAIQQIPLFDKCRGFTRAKEAQAAGLYPYFTPITEAEDTVVTIHGKTKVMMGSNNYLGLTHHPKVLEAAAAALRKYGSGCTGSRFLNGTLDLHEILEARLAEFLHKEACVIFSTGYQANLGLVSGLLGKGEMAYLDKLDHASIFDGAAMSKASVVRFNHGDLAGLDKKLSEAGRPQGAMVIVDGVFSMEGDIADLPHLVPLAKKHGVALAVDDAHSIGVLGATGAGTAEHFGLTDEVDLIVGTFSKSLASIGGFVAGAEYVIHYLKHHARPLIFTAALPASNTAGVIAALEIVQTEPERRAALWENTRHLAGGLKSLGFDIGPSETPIVPVLIGPLEKTLVVWRELFDAGVFTNPVVPPAVPPSQCRLRASVMATHTPAQVDFALEAFAGIAKAVGVL